MRALEQALAMFSPDGEPPLSFAQWCETAPRLAGRAPEERAAVLAAAAIDPALWEPADGFWTVTLALELGRGEPARAEAHGRACAAAWQASARPPSSGDEDTLPGEAGEAEAGEALAGEAPQLSPGAAVPATALPTFLRPAATPCTAAAVALAAPAFVSAPPPLAAPAFVSAPPPATRPEAVPARAAVTLEVSPAALSPGRPWLPFAPAPAGGHDRRAEGGTVELDPAQLTAYFATRPPR